MGGWVKTLENENIIIYGCAMCNNPEHNYIVIKTGMIIDNRKKKRKKNE